MWENSVETLPVVFALIFFFVVNWQIANKTPWVNSTELKHTSTSTQLIHKTKAI